MPGCHLDESDFENLLGEKKYAEAIASLPALDPEIKNIQSQKPKQVILVRNDLKMKVGKIASQVAHASMKVFFDRATKGVNDLSQLGIKHYSPKLEVPLTYEMSEWVNGEFTKVILQVNSEEELLTMFAKAYAAGLPCSLIQDNGHTVFKGVKTYTTAAIGPANAESINELTGHLKLL